MTLQERFERFTEPDPNTGCHLWSGTPNAKGYGRINIDQTIYLAHRVSWEMRHGPIPDGLCVCHRCDTPPCVNPDHLFLGTRQDNTADAVAKRRMPHGERASSTRLRPADVDEIRRLVRAGVIQRIIAARFGIAQMTVSFIASGRSWKYHKSEAA